MSLEKEKTRKKTRINSEDLLILFEETTTVIVIYGHILAWYRHFLDVQI